MGTLYNDVADANLAPKLEAAMIPHALAAFETPASAPAWAESAFNERRAYIRTTDDQCNPFSLQELWIAKSGVTWQIEDLKSSHCPFVSQPEETARVVLGVIGGWI